MEFTQEQVNQMIAEATKGLFTQTDLEKQVTAETDRRVESGIQKGLETHRIKWEEEYKQKANMTAEEIARKEYEEKHNSLTELEKNLRKKQNELEAKHLLNEAGVPKSHYDNFIGMLVTDNDQVTTTNVNNFINMFNTTKTDIETQIKSQLSNITPPPAGGQGGTVTKQDFDKMGYTEKIKFKEKNPELYKQYIK